MTKLSHIFSRTVKSPGILYYLQTDKLDSHCFVAVVEDTRLLGQKQRTLLLLYSRQPELHVRFGSLVPQVSQGLCRVAWVDAIAYKTRNL